MITPSATTVVMIEKAKSILSDPKDPNHGLDHVNEALKYTNKFFEETGDQFAINKEVVLLSIYWHDVWKSRHRPTVFNYLFYNLYEGLGSMFMFKQSAKEAGLPKDITDQVAYAIKKHSTFQLFPTKSLEAKLLWDVDTLDCWNHERSQNVIKELAWKKVFLVDMYVFYMKYAGFKLYFDWTKNEVEKTKEIFFKEMASFRTYLINENHTSSTAQDQLTSNAKSHI